MFISEIPVRCRTEKTIRWIGNLTAETTVHDILSSILPTEDLQHHSLYLVIGHHRQVLTASSSIYEIVAAYNQKPCARRLLFEIRRTPSKKRVRFADEVLSESIHNHRVATKSSTRPKGETEIVPIEKRLEKLKENFQKHVERQQEKHRKAVSKRMSLASVDKNIPKSVSIQRASIKQLSRSSSESGISSSESTDDFSVQATLV